MQLKIPRVFDQSTFDTLSFQFEANTDASFVMPAELSVGEIRELALFLLHQDSLELRNMLLADIVEYDNFPEDILEEVFYKGDIGCRVAVSLRDDLSPQLEELCAESPEEDVCEHYAIRKKYNAIRSLG